MARHLVLPLTVTLLSACAFETPGQAEAELVVTDRCVIDGIGLLAPDGDYFTGEARGSDTGALGNWLHIGPDGTSVFGQAEFILCRLNGALLGDFGGRAAFNLQPGYTFRVAVHDNGPPEAAEFVSGTPSVETVRASRSYRPSRWVDGHLPIEEERTRVVIPSELPVTVGNAGNQWAEITFERSETHDVVTCRYRGDARRPNPRRPRGWVGGERYVFERCTGPGGGGLAAGDEVDVGWLSLHVQSGDHMSCDDPETEVAVDFHVTPQLLRVTRPDHYRIGVWDDATGERVYIRDGDVATGDIELIQLD